MLFNSPEFILLFLPLTLAGFFLLARISQTSATGWLFLASVFFYGWWDWKYIPLLLGSIIFHFWVGLWLMRLQGGAKKVLLISAIVLDLSLLVYYKYADMFIGTWNTLSGGQIAALGVILPLGISFFTFTQIAYLVDVYEGKVKESRPVHFGLFVTYFPHLIAGPVLHHKEMMPQFANPSNYKPKWQMLALGTAIFVVGLAKKVLLADNIAGFANGVFAHPADATLVQAWVGVLAYSFQLYFDFSGYSDMAVGLSLMIGIRLPINFYSPYKSVNISEFWRRWHMTLSRFLRDYLYIKMGGNRHGKLRRYFNLLMTMFLGGLWHGAGWNFALWGLMHGLYLVIHEGWRSSLGKYVPTGKASHAAAVTFTFLAVILAWVPFRAASLGDTLVIWKAMFGLSGIGLPEVVFSLFPQLGEQLKALGIRPMIGGGSQLLFGAGWLAVAFVVAFACPNTYQLFRKFRPVLADATVMEAVRVSRNPAIRFSRGWAVVLGLVLVAAALGISRPSEFLYFQF